MCETVVCPRNSKRKRDFRGIWFDFCAPLQNSLRCRWRLEVRVCLRISRHRMLAVAVYPPQSDIFYYITSKLICVIEIEDSVSNQISIDPIYK